MSTITKHEGEWDEDRGGPRDPHNYISYPINGLVHHSTKNVWPWKACGSHDQGRVIVPPQGGTTAAEEWRIKRSLSTHAHRRP